MMLIQLLILISSLTHSLSQICRLKNTEYNLITTIQDEQLRIPLNNYFIGEGLNYQLSNNSNFTIQNLQYGPGEVDGTIISITPMPFNNNPNLFTSQYYALSAISQFTYQILQSSISLSDQTTLNFNNAIDGLIISGQVCYEINAITNNLILTCVLNTTNTLNYIFYNILTNTSQSFNQLQITVSESVIDIETEVSNSIIATLIKSNTTSNLTVFYFDNSTIQEFSININYKKQSDYVTGMQLQEFYLFISTYYDGVQLYDLQQAIEQSTTVTGTSIMNPFGSGTIGISANNIDQSSNYYYIAIWSDVGIITTIYNPFVTDIFSSQQIIQTQQITMNNYITSQVYLSYNYLIIVNQNGISVYPSILNNINNGLLLQYLAQSTYINGFDTFNNILVYYAIDSVYTFQIDEQYLITTPNFLTNNPIQFSINASTLTFNQNEPISCPTLTLYLQVIATPSNNNIQIYQQYYLNQSNTFLPYIPEGQLFNLTFGQSQIIDLNQIFIAPSLLVSNPIVYPASTQNLDKTYTNVLETPNIKSIFGTNTKLLNNEEIIYSQIFYDPSFLQINDNTYNYDDTYLQLVQVQNFIVLYQCDGLKNVACTQIIYFPISLIIVKQFGLGLANGNIYISFLFTTKSVGTSNIEQKIGFYQLTINSSVPTGYTQLNNTLDTSVFNQDEETVADVIISDIIIEQIGQIKDQLFVIVNINTENGQQLQLSSIQASDIIEWQSPNVLNINVFSYNSNIQSFNFQVAAYGNLLFLNSFTIDQVDDQSQYTYSLIIANSMDENWGIVGEIQICQSDEQISLIYGLTMDGIYIVNQNEITIQFYPRIELIPQLFKSLATNDYSYLITINPISIPIYNITSINYVQASSRYLYIMATVNGLFDETIYVYKNTPSTLNCLYYIIQTQTSVQNQQFSVASAMKYDAILLRSSSDTRYSNNYLLPKYEIEISCNLNSNSQYQIEYNYLGMKASSLLLGTEVSSSSKQYWTTFNITNLVSFVTEIQTVQQNLTLNNNGQIFIDPRQLFSGNIQAFYLTNGTSQNGYYTTLIQTVESNPQIQYYQNGKSAISTYVELSDSDQGSYWYTFVQTDYLVYITPYIYYTPTNINFITNSTVKIDYPYIYKLPILYLNPNSQSCPLIFVDQYSQGVVSVCGTKREGVFLVSFTLFDPQTQNIIETQIIDLSTSFNIDMTNDEESATYTLQQATYLEIGVILLQFRYSYNYGQIPPTDVLLPFLYIGSLNNKNIVNLNQQSAYQLIQPIDSVFYVPNSDSSEIYSISAYSVTNQFFGGLTSNTNTTSTPSIAFGLICASNTNEQCLANSYSDNAIYYSGVTVTIQFSSSFIGQYLNQTITVYSVQNGSAQNQVYSSLVMQTFDISIQSLLQDYALKQITQVTSLGIPFIQNDISLSNVPLVIVSEGTAYIIRLTFYIPTGQFIQSYYACTLLGLTNSNKILQVSSASSFTSNSEIYYQIITIVENPSKEIENQVTLLNYGNINDWCIGLTEEVPNEVIVTSIGSYSYESVEDVPILNLMIPIDPSTQELVSSNIPRTLISNNKYIQLLDTNNVVTISVFPDYNQNGGVTLNTTNIENSGGISTQITSLPITIFINNNQIKGDGGSTMLMFDLSSIQSTVPWSRKLWGQFIWGFFMLAIILTVLGYLFYKSQQQNEYYQ